MTVSSTIRKAGPYSGNGSTTAFPFEFKVFETSDLRLVRFDADGVEYELALNSDYSVTLNSDQDNNPGGVITYPLTGNRLASGETLVGLGAMVAKQETDITNLGRFLPQVIEDAFDKQTILSQQLGERLGRTLAISPADEDLPAALPPANERRGKFLVFDAAGNPVVSQGLGSDADLRTDLAQHTGSGLVGHVTADGEQIALDDYLNRIASAGQQLHFIAAQCAAGVAVKFACYGDSTTDGNETTGWSANPTSGGAAVGAGAHTPPNAWPAKFQAAIRAAFGNSNITVWNAGYTGQEMSNGWAYNNYDAAITNNPAYGVPDVCFIAFGLNDINQAGSDYLDHRAWTIRLILKLRAAGTIPVLVACDPIARNSGSARDNRESTREINEIKRDIAFTYRIPYIDVERDMKDWMSVNLEGHAWGTAQADSLHFGDAGHALKAGSVLRHIFPNTIVIRPGDGWRRVCAHDSDSGNVGKWSDLTTVAKVAQGSNNNYQTGAPTLTAMMTLMVFNLSPDTELIYRGIAHERYAGSSTTLCPRVKITHLVTGATVDRAPCGVGFAQDGTAGTYRKSDIPYRVGHLRIGLSKVEYVSGDADELFYGNFELWQTPRECGLSSIGRSNCLRMAGPFQHSFSGSGLQSVLLPEYRDGSNVYGLMGSDVVDIIADVTMPQGVGLIFTSCQTWKDGAVHGDKVYGMLYRHTDDSVRLHIGSVEAGTTGYLATVMGESLPLTWTSDRSILRLRIDRAGSEQVIRLWDSRSAAGTAVMIATRTFAEGSFPWGGAVGGFFCNGAVTGTATAVIHELTMFRR